MCIHTIKSGSWPSRARARREKEKGRRGIQKVIGAQIMKGAQKVIDAQTLSNAQKVIGDR